VWLAGEGSHCVRKAHPRDVSVSAPALPRQIHCPCPTQTDELPTVDEEPGRKHD
jgi:hypothetical protein